MNSLEKFGAISREFEETADFISIYIAEAHPLESGDLGQNYEWKFKTHERFEDRIEAAKALEKSCKDMKINGPVLVDFMDNSCNKNYGACEYGQLLRSCVFDIQKLLIRYLLSVKV